MPIETAIHQVVEAFGGRDICINNASVINLAGTFEVEPKRYDLMMGVKLARHLPAQPRLPAVPAQERERPHPHPQPAVELEPTLAG